MNKTRRTPLWVFLAFSAVETRKGAMLLIRLCVLFTLYCLPWNLITNNALGEIGNTIFLINDWSWFAMMLPICIWYIASLRWMDKHDGWTPRPAGAEV